MKRNHIIALSVLVIMAILSLFSIKNLEIYAFSNFDDMSADNYIVMDTNGKVLLEKNCDERHEVASICKLMTTLITLESIDKGYITEDTLFRASKYASDAEGSQAFLDNGSSYSVRDLLKSVIVASANDSAIVLAEGIAGSENAFVDLMNNRAKELGMTNTLYNNSTGLHAGEQYSTARDTAIILNVVSKYDLYQKDSNIWMDELIHPSGRKTELVNTNRLIKYYEYCCTGKTGFTDEAGYCLSSTATKDGMKLTCVVLGCDSSADRFTESISLYNHCYANFKNVKILSHENTIENDVKIIGGKRDMLRLKPAEDFYYTQLKTEQNDFELVLDIPEELKAPIQSGQEIGKVLITIDGDIVGEVSLIAENAIDKQNFSDIFAKIIDRFSY